MKIVVLFNPISGAGGACQAAQMAAEQLRSAGHVVQVEPTRLEAPKQWLDGLLAGVQLLVVSGGDGAVRLAAGSAHRTGVPLYQIPRGTENLFAREFGMDRRPTTLLRALERFDVRHVDVGIANGRIFLLMASVGFDADVVHDLAGRRGGSISHFSYILPILSQLRRWTPARLRVSVDGQPLEHDGTGFVVVANSRQYGWRLNPAGRASMNDGQLDVAYFPARSRRELIGWALRCRMQRHLDDRRLIYRLGRQVRISGEAPLKYQLDGDPPGVIHELMPEGVVDPPADQPLSLVIAVKPNALPVLVPVGEGGR